MLWIKTRSFSFILSSRSVRLCELTMASGEQLGDDVGDQLLQAWFRRVPPIL